MSLICPAILASEPEQYRQQIERVASFASRIQVDIMDGQFVDTRSINLIQVWWPESIQADIHLMVNDPSQQFETLVSLKPNLVIVHAEAQTNLKQLLQDLQEHHLKTGLAVLPTTSLASVQKLLSSVDHLLVFGGHLGHQGGSADLSQLTKVSQARQLYPKLEIGWDGGVNPDNLPQLASAGVDIFNVGSYLQSAAEPKKAYDLLTSLL